MPLKSADVDGGVARRVKGGMRRSILAAAAIPCWVAACSSSSPSSSSPAAGDAGAPDSSSASSADTGPGDGGATSADGGVIVTQNAKVTFPLSTSGGVNGMVFDLLHQTLWVATYDSVDGSL